MPGAAPGHRPLLGLTLRSACAATPSLSLGEACPSELPLQPPMKAVQRAPGPVVLYLSRHTGDLSSRPEAVPLS